MRRLRTRAAIACSLLASLSALAVEPSKDLIGAFTATYQHAPPLVRTVKQPILDEEHPNHVFEVLTQTARLAPLRLVKLSKARYALLVSETLLNVGHAWPGAFSIAYLDYSKRWRLEHVWPELTFMGETGIPADETWQAYFWTKPLVFASSTYCGMGGCTADIAAFALGDAAPRLLGTVPGSAEYGPNEPALGDCETYHYVARIGPARLKNNVFSVRFSGWTAPPGRTEPKQWFSRTTDYAISRNMLIARPEVSIPDCGK
ncbi:hypothetical protein [Lichenicoccus sp.]|uniref:hypothetical protein n=1 Tax=Lichenicoccus sp. TaxID=2781899 RepID=UPI003D0D0ADC